MQVGNSSTGWKNGCGMNAVGTMLRHTQAVHGTSALTWRPMQRLGKTQAAPHFLTCGMKSLMMMQIELHLAGFGTWSVYNGTQVKKSMHRIIGMTVKLPARHVKGLDTRLAIDCLLAHREGCATVSS